MLINPAYFGPIIQFVGIVNANKLTFEISDNYQKQTYRNRCYIYGPNGIQLLTVPVVHSKSDKKQKIKEIRVDNSSKWQKLHNRALHTAYRSSPFFEFYIDDLQHIFNKEYEFLIDLNFDTISAIFSCLELTKNFETTDSYESKPEAIDLRYLINAKKSMQYTLKTYIQVFQDKHAYIPNLSILDLIFNEGPNTLQYLEDSKNSLF
jgi:hypothetical protein